MRHFVTGLLALLFLVGVGFVSSPATADAASCVRFSATHFNATGDDNYNLNGEWVRIKNYCSTTKSLSGYKIHDYGKKHTYTFATGVKIKSGYSITLYSGKGSNTTTKRFWQRSYGAVWNNSAPEYAYLRNSAGTLLSKRTEY